MDNLSIRECTYKDLDYIISLQQQWNTEDITYGFDPAENDNIKRIYF